MRIPTKIGNKMISHLEGPLFITLKLLGNDNDNYIDDIHYIDACFLNVALPI